MHAFFFVCVHFPRCGTVGKGALDDGRTVVFVLSYLPLLPTICCCAFLGGGGFLERRYDGFVVKLADFAICEVGGGRRENTDTNSCIYIQLIDESIR